jgi:hypothetical protein
LAKIFAIYNAQNKRITMDWGKVTYIFFSLMSLTTTAGFLYEPNEIALFVAAGVNIISTVLKLGVRNLLAAELLASSLVADLHLIPAFMVLTFTNDLPLAISLAIGAVVANVFSIALALIESAKSQDKEEF